MSLFTQQLKQLYHADSFTAGAPGCVNALLEWMLIDKLIACLVIKMCPRTQRFLQVCVSGCKYMYFRVPSEKKKSLKTLKYPLQLEKNK